MASKTKRVYRSWNEETMDLALKAIDEGLSLCEAAKEFCIPKQTLSNWKKQKW